MEKDSMEKTVKEKRDVFKLKLFSGWAVAQEPSSSANVLSPILSSSRAAPATGFDAPIQPQFTAYPGQGQPQGYQAQQQQPHYTGCPQAQQQALQQQQLQAGQVPQTQIPQKTAQTSAQIAASFAPTAPVQAQRSGHQQSIGSSKIPKIRLSFLTATDQAKFEQLFKSAVREAQASDGFQPNPQPTGYSGPRPPLPPMPIGYGSNLSPLQTGTQPPLPLNAQPTGRAGQWGFVNAPASVLPNIEALQQRMMPQPRRESGYTNAGLAGSATVPWAVTKDEKRSMMDSSRRGTV
ncbi:MAG: hypothetical protein Q9180_000403 [Flavoplaca navasiana]